jgi:hypothetical protein
MPAQIPWRRVVVEGVVIVASILLAFGIDAWWAEQTERRAEREDLVRIRDELVADRGRLEDFANSQAQSAAASLAVLELIADLPTTTGTIESSDSLLALLLRAPTFESQTPALDGLLESGRVSIVRDADVRAAIARYRRSLSNASGRQDEAGDFVDQHLFPDLIHRGSVGDLLLNSRGAVRLAAIDPAAMRRIRVDDVFTALVSQRYVTAAHTRVNMNGVVRALDELVAAIEASLGR